MNRVSLNIVLLVAVLIMGTSLASLHGQNQRAGKTAVGVIDMREVFQGLKERTEMDARLNTKAEENKEEARKRALKIQELQENLDVANPKGKTAKDLEDQIMEGLIGLKAFEEVWRKQLEKEALVQTKSLHRKIKAAVKKVAERQGYDLILYADNERDLVSSSPQGLDAEIQQRKVVFATEEVKITSQVIQMMNNEFNANRN